MSISGNWKKKKKIGQYTAIWVYIYLEIRGRGIAV